jgi:hypothetical protein
MTTQAANPNTGEATCSTCRYSFSWKQPRPTDFSGTMEPFRVVWECRRRSVPEGGFPATQADWWCGEHTPNAPLRVLERSDNNLKAEVR